MAGANSRIVVFVRHGESLSNATFTMTDAIEGYPLTEFGRKAALETGMGLRKLSKVDGFYSSPVQRARQTADIISDCIGKGYAVDGLLRERSMGKYGGFRAASEEALKKVNLEQIGQGYPDLESWSNLQNRMMKFVGKLKTGNVTVAISHGDPIKSVASIFLGKSEEEMLYVDVPKASLTVMDFGRSGASAVIAVGAKSLPDVIFS